MKAGTHIVDVVDCGVTPDKDMNPRPYITFKNENGETIKWMGNVSTEKAVGFAVKTARTIGFTGDDWDKFNMANVSPCKVEIEVTHEKGKKDPTKSFATVKWINEIKSVNVMSAGEVKAKLSSKAAFAQRPAKATPQKPEVPF